MKRMRLVLLMLALSVAVGLPVQSAVVCHTITNCEIQCEPKLESCYNGTFHSECGGDLTCCQNAMAACFACCEWF